MCWCCVGQPRGIDAKLDQWCVPSHSKMYIYDRVCGNHACRLSSYLYIWMCVYVCMCITHVNREGLHVYIYMTLYMYVVKSDFEIWALTKCFAEFCIFEMYMHVHILWFVTYSHIVSYYQWRSLTRNLWGSLWHFSATLIMVLLWSVWMVLISTHLSELMKTAGIDWIEHTSIRNEWRWLLIVHMYGTCLYASSPISRSIGWHTPTWQRTFWLGGQHIGQLPIQ